MDLSFLPYRLRGFDRAYLRAFRSCLPAEDQAAYDARLTALLRAEAPRVTDPLAQSHTVVTLAALSAYRGLRAAGLAKHAAIAEVTCALTRPGARMIHGATWLGARLTRDLLGFVEGQSRSKAARVYGLAFEMSHQRSPGHYEATVQRCAYVDLLQRHQTPQLAPAFCAWDALWLEALPPRIDATRPCTLACGATCCRFVFVDRCHGAVTPRA